VAWLIPEITWLSTKFWITKLSQADTCCFTCVASTMNRRASYTPASTHRRGSLAEAAKQKRVSLKEGTLGTLGTARLAALSEIKDGDVFYRTERIYPSIPDHPEDVLVTVAARTTRDTRTGSIVSLGKEDSLAPGEGPESNRDR